LALREMPGTPSLLDAPDYLELVAQVRPDRAGREAYAARQQAQA
jgi:hypothetical protein